jgi:hypothetical protein
MVAPIILFTLALSFLIIALYCSIKTNEIYILLALPAVILFCLGLALLYPSPTTEDVKNGMAQYIEQRHIDVNSVGDTVANYVTYKIEWKEEYKYGRKH